MRDGEWSLTHAGGSATFGLVDNSALLATFPEIGDAEITTDDSARPRTDGTAFGTDYRAGRTLTFDLRVLGTDEASVRAATGALARVWRGDAVRSTPGAVATLRTQQAGRESIAWGRPRKWAVNDQNAKLGVISVLCTFDTSDDLWYDATPSAVVVGIAPPAGGGFVAPVISPLTTTRTADRSIKLTVGGEADTWITVDFAGPVTNPTVGIVGLWEIALSTSLSAGQIATVDTRPWSRGVYRAGTNLSGSLGRTSIRLSRASVPPGTHEMYFRGIDATATASMAVTWRNSRTTL